MAFTLPQQVKHLIETSNHVLVCFRPDAGGDAVGTSLALKLFLEQERKHVDIVSSDFNVPSHLAFLPGVKNIKSKLSNLQKMIIKAHIGTTGVDEIAYAIKNGDLNIFITPTSGTLQQQDFLFEQSPYRYDLIFVIDTPDLQSLGDMYDKHTDLFFNTPLVCIDNDPSNEHFGHINLVELTATSAAEVLFHVIEQLKPQALNADIAQCLLTGLIAETKSFKTAQVSPHTLSVAGRLVEAGADREAIVEHLYRTRSLQTLKLWARALGQLEGDKHLGIVWTSVTRDDFKHSGTNEKHLPALIDDLISNAPEAKVSAVFYECPGDNDKVCVLVTSERQFDAKLLTKPFTPKGTKHQVQLEFTGKRLHEVRELVVGNIKQLLTV